MSRYTLLHPGKFSEVVFGWDEALAGFFLQCFAANANPDADDYGPVVWRTGLALRELRKALEQLDLELLDFATRVLEAEERGVSFRFAEGDPAIWRTSSSNPYRPCTVLEHLLTFARVRWPNGEEQYCIADELEPDLATAGFERD